jgi:hypothetical protein
MSKDEGGSKIAYRRARFLAHSPARTAVCFAR